MPLGSKSRPRIRVRPTTTNALALSKWRNFRPTPAHGSFAFAGFLVGLILGLIINGKPSSTVEQSLPSPHLTSPPSALSTPSSPAIAAPTTVFAGISMLTPDAVTQVSTIIALTNDLRTSLGLSTLTEVSLLTQAAQIHSNDMALNTFFSHIGSDGSQVGERVLRVGYQWAFVAENLLQTPLPLPDLAFEGWRASPQHYANLISPNVTQIGLALALSNQNYYYTMVLAKPA